MKRGWPVSVRTVALRLVLLATGLASAQEVSGVSAPAPSFDLDNLDTAAIIQRLDDVNLSKASDKIGFSGLLYNRVFNHQYLEFPPNLSNNAAATMLDANYTLKINLNANPFVKAWTMATFGYGFEGNFLNEKDAVHPGQINISPYGLQPDTLVSDESRAPYMEDQNREGARIFEDLMAGANIRTEPVDADVSAGGTLWMEGSPLTIWKRDPRPHLAWYYEAYEPEESAAMYYNQKFFYRVNDLGRETWPKKAFGGIEIDAFRMPGDFGLKLDFAQPTNMLPTSTDGDLNASVGDPEALGSINSIGQLYFARLTHKKIFKDLMGGLNVLWVQLPPDIIDQRIYNPDPVQGYVFEFRNGQPYYAQPRVFSFDTRGNLSPTLFLQTDVAMTFDDSVKYNPVLSGNDTVYNGNSSVNHKLSMPTPAAYLKTNSNGSLPMETELFYASKQFWSPYAMTEYGVPVHRDEMKLGVGSFSYETNLLGLSWKVSPKVSTGFFDFTVGESVQPQAGKDILRFQHTLNGREEWYSTTSWSKTDPRMMLDEGGLFGNPQYQGRLGDVSRENNVLLAQEQPGGLRGDDLEVWEEFAAYDNAQQADSGNVPEHQKVSSDFALDWGYDIGSLLGYPRPFMLALYSTVTSIATDLSGPLDTKNTLLWSGMARFEPAIAVTQHFYVLGLVGAETWKSDKAYINTLYNQTSNTYPIYNYPNTTPVIYNNVNYYVPLSSLSAASQNAVPYVIAQHAPIDYLQMAYGIGCDWDFSQRAGLHLRFKYATHEDKYLPSNNWQGAFLFGEMKVWF